MGVSQAKYKVVTQPNLHNALINCTCEKKIKVLINKASTDDLKAVDYMGRAPLHCAIYRTWSFNSLSIELFRLLLDKGAEVNVLDIYNCTPLHMVAKIRSSKSASMCDLLLNNGANINAKNNKKQTPLHIAILRQNYIICRVLLTRGADVNARDDYDQTPLHTVTASCIDTSICEMILNRGAQVNAQDLQNQTPLHIAILENNRPVLELLLNRGAEVNLKDECNKTPLHYATDVLCFSPAVELLLEKGSQVNLKTTNGFSPLHIACSAWFLGSSRAIIRTLLDYGADIEDKNDLGDSPLTLAMTSHAFLTVFEFLIDKGAKVNIKDLKGNSPLHFAVVKGRRELINKVLCKGAKIEAKDSKGRTALHIAVMAARDVSIIKLLLKKGADVNNEDNNGATPLHLALVSEGNHPLSLSCRIIAALLDWDYSLSDDNRTSPLLRKHLKRQFIRRELVNLQVSKKFEFKYLSGFDAYRLACSREVESMKSITFNQYSLHDVFTKYNNPSFFLDPKLEKVVHGFRLDLMFPIYGLLLLSTFVKVKKRFVLMNRVEDNLISPGERLMPLPNEMVRKILSYISLEDLQKMV